MHSLKFLTTLFIATLLFALIQCTPSEQSKIAQVSKLSPTDPFKESITESQFFEMLGEIDNVLEGKNGTRITLPKGCFKNSKGETIKKEIKVELAEALTLDEMILSNLTTTSDGKPLETDGMIFINATSNGEQLIIDPENPVYIEIPTQKRKPGMMAYKGIRNEKGNMNWIEPKELDKFLIPVDMNLLNFFPEGFETEVELGMPFRKHKTAGKELKDSLYYSLSVSQLKDFTRGFKETEYNEPYYNKNKNKKIINRKYTSGSFTYKTTQASESGTMSDTASCSDCGIDPAIIKSIRNKKFQNTLISTREFESRLQVIFKTCQNAILENYIKNLDKNLWELDEMAYKALEKEGSSPLKKEFKRFADQKLTNVKGAEKYAVLLKSYYEKQLRKIKEDLQKVKAKNIHELNKKNKEVEKVAKEYKELLFKREKYRMETYGFTWTDNGWINIDVGVIPKDWGPKKLELIVSNGKAYDQIYSYVVYTSIKSIYRLNTNDKELFYVGNESDKSMLMPNNQLTYVLSIAYKNDQKFLGVKTFQTGEEKISLALQESTTEEIKKTIKEFKGYEQENRIDKDLEYQEYFYKEKMRQQQLQKEEEFIHKLRGKAFNCQNKGLIDEEPTEQRE